MVLQVVGNLEDQLRTCTYCACRPLSSDSSRPPTTIEFVGWHVFLPLPIYVVPIGLAFINPLLAAIAWLSYLFSLRQVDRKYEWKSGDELRATATVSRSRDQGLKRQIT